MRKILRYIASKKCTRRLWVLSLIWLIIGVIPALVGNVVYPLVDLPPDIVLPSEGWRFWIHRVAVDPLTKGIGAVPCVLLITMLALRVFTVEGTAVEPILRSEGASEAHDGFWGWETRYTR